MRITGDSPAAGSGEGSTSRQGPAATLDDAMRAPSTNPPEVVVLDTMPDGLGRKEYLDPKEDLWLSTADARYSSPIIPLRVGEPPHQETFFVHKNILLKYEYFDKALCGEFRESQAQSIDLPEENPATFHFLVAFLYEGRYVPIRPMSAALDPELDKGKGKEVGTETPDSDSDSSGSATSGNSVVSLRRLDRQRRRHDRHFERMRQKHPGHHRPNCHCPQCLAAGGPPCWHCAAPRVAPHPPGIPPPPPPGIAVVDRDRSRRHQRRRHPPLAPPLAPPPPPDPNGGGRIRGEDMRTWLLTYELNLDVYILANKFLLDGFKREVARACIDMLETAGSDAARPEVLRLCTKLYHGLSETDPLLKMIFARIGFLQPALWRTAAQETSDFLVTNPEIAALLLRETGNRREEDSSGRSLPSMEMPWVPPPDSPYRAPPPYHIARPRRQW